jgi:hypothetical protein
MGRHQNGYSGKQIFTSLKENKKWVVKAKMEEPV